MNKILLMTLLLSMTSACTKKALSELAANEDTGAGGGGGSGGGSSLTGESYSIFPKVKSDGSGYEGFEIYKKTSTGSTKGTLVKDLGEGNVFPFFKYFPGNTNTTMFFTKYSADTGTELWKSDGTTNGTAIVEELVSGADSTYFTDNCSATTDNNVALDLSKDQTAYLNTALLFTVYECASGNPYVGQEELWISDGTANGTRRYAEVLGLTDGSDGQGHTYKYTTTLVRQLNNQYALISVNRNDELATSAVPVVPITHGYKLILASATGQVKEITIPNTEILYDTIGFLNIDGDDVFIKTSTKFYSFRLTDATPTLTESTDNPNFIQPDPYGVYSGIGVEVIYGKMLYHYADNGSVWKVWNATTQSFDVNNNIPSDDGVMKLAGNSFVYVRDSDKAVYHCNSGLTTCTALTLNSSPLLMKDDKAVTVSQGLLMVQDLGNGSCDFVNIRQDGTIDSMTGFKSQVASASLLISYCQATASALNPRNVSTTGSYFGMNGLVDIQTYEMQGMLLDSYFDVVETYDIAGAGGARTMYHIFEDYFITIQNAATLNNVNQLLLLSF